MKLLFLGANIHEAILSTIEQWSLSAEGMMCITSDSGSNMIRAANLGGWQRLSCWGHNLHKAVNHGRGTGKVVGACKLVSELINAYMVCSIAQ